jgi:hypothetical protein
MRYWALNDEIRTERVVGYGVALLHGPPQLSYYVISVFRRKPNTSHMSAKIINSHTYDRQMSVISQDKA